MTIGHLLQQAQKIHLRTELEVILAYLLGVSRLDLIAHSEEQIPVDKLAELQKAWIQIQDGVPVAYLTHQKEFYGFSFYVNEAVLVPRGETECLVDHVLEKVKNFSRPVKILEIGTGSGVISVALKKTRADLEIMATDVSEEALTVANKNIVQYGAEIRLIQSDLLEKVPAESFDILVTNLPYIGEKEHRYIAENVEKHEPHLALFGGENGLKLYERLFEQINEQNRSFAYILGEIGFTQAEDLKSLATAFFPDFSLEIAQDGQGLDRHFILARP